MGMTECLGLFLHKRYSSLAGQLLLLVLVVWSTKRLDGHRHWLGNKPLGVSIAARFYLLLFTTAY